MMESVFVGPTSDQELQEIILAGGRKGQIYKDLLALRDRYADLIRARFPNIKRRVSGYNLDQLLPENGFNVARALVGTEGTCALTLAAKVRLVKSPAKRVVLVLGFGSLGCLLRLFMEQRLARSRCFCVVFVFEHFFYSSAMTILYAQF